MSNININSLITKKSEILSSEIDGEVVMMNIETGQYISMNAVGSEIWKMIEENPITVKGICDNLLKIFRIDQPTCEQEAVDFCNQLLKEKLIHLN